VLRATTKAAAADPVVGAVLGGMDPQQAIVAGGGALFDVEYDEHATSVWHLSDGAAGAQGGWASGPQPDGQHEFGSLQDPQPLGDVASAPLPDPKL
jgi:Mn-containing catalase